MAVLAELRRAIGVNGRGAEKYPAIALASGMPRTHIAWRERRVPGACGALSLEFQGLCVYCERGVDTPKAGAILRALPGKRRFRGAFAD
jgi:hypothetical protein